MGFLNAAGSAPVILVGLFAGVWVDRLRRKQVMIWSDIARSVLLLSIPIAALFHVLNFGQLYLVAALTGVAALFFEVAYRSYLPSLVRRENVLEGNRYLTISEFFAELAGPGLAGFLIQAFTAPVAILVDSASFLVSVGSLVLIRKKEPAPVNRQPSQKVISELIEGIKIVWQHPILKPVALSTATRSLFGSFFGVLYGIFALKILGLGPALLGITIAFGGISDIIGSLGSVWVARRFGIGRTMIGTLLLAALASFFIPFANGSVWMAAGYLMAAQLFGDGLGVIYSITEVSLRQAVTPDRLLGRVNAGIQVMADGIGPVGALAGGALAQIFGIRPTLFIASVGLVLSAAWLIFSQVRTIQSIPQSLDENLLQD